MKGFPLKMLISSSLTHILMWV